jgi:hypothetical protein
MKKQKFDAQINEPTKLKTKLGIFCLAGILISILVMFLTSLDDVFFFVTLVFTFLAIVLLSPSERFSNSPNNKISKWVFGDKVDPSNPFNINRRYSSK